MRNGCDPLQLIALDPRSLSNHVAEGTIRVAVLGFFKVRSGFTGVFPRWKLLGQVRRADSDSLRLGQGGGSNAGHPKGRPRSGCSDDPLRSLTSRSLAKALRGNAPRGLAPPMLSRGMLPRNIGCRLSAPWHSPLRPWWGSIRFMSPTANRPCLRHRIPKMIRSGREREARQQTSPLRHRMRKNDPKPDKTRNRGGPLFPSLFLLCYLLSRKLSKPMIYLSDFQLGPHRPPCFYWKYPCFLFSPGFRSSYFGAPIQPLRRSTSSPFPVCNRASYGLFLRFRVGAYLCAGERQP